MTLITETSKGRVYQGSMEEAFKFALEFNGVIQNDYEQFLQGNLIVIIMKADFEVRLLSDYDSKDLDMLMFQISNRITDIKYNMKPTQEKKDILKNLDIWLYRLVEAHKIASER